MDREIDLNNLRGVLMNISNELEVPYIEKRNTSFNQSPVDELANAVSEITRLEREMQAAVGIANMLIENNESLKLRLQSLAQQKDAQLQELREDLDYCKAKETQYRQRMHELADELLKAEETNRELYKENSQILVRLSDVKAGTELLGFQNVLTEFLDKLKHSKPTESNISRQKSEISDKAGGSESLTQENTKLAKENSALNCRLAKLESTLRTLQEKLADFEHCHDCLIEENRACKAELKQLKQQVVLQRAKVEFSEDFGSEEISLSRDLAELVCETQIRVEIFACPEGAKRKNPEEEYFILVSFI